MITCSVCNKELLNEDGLKIHMTRMHGAEDGKVKNSDETVIMSDGTKMLSNDLESKVNSLSSAVEKLTRLITESVVTEKEIPARPDIINMAPAWKDAAFDILGDYIDDLQAFYPSSGGCLFTVVIKREKSNASQSHWEMHKQDRRTKELGNTGLEGVKKWCELIKKNLTGNHAVIN